MLLPPSRRFVPAVSSYSYYGMMLFFLLFLCRLQFSHGDDDEFEPITHCTPDQTIVLDNTTKTLSLAVNNPQQASSVCLLWRITINEARIPLARSYQSHDWETYSTSSAAAISWECTHSNNSSNNVCHTTLPSTTDTLRYELISYTRSRELTHDEIAARFLEQTTFGPTLEEIQSLDTVSIETLARWIQQQSQLPMTSHRATFRTHVNHRFPIDGVTWVGRVTYPCQTGTRYRRAAFSDKDGGAMVELRTLTSTQKGLYLHSQLRTVLHNVTQLYIIHTETNQTQSLWDGMFLICDEVETWTGGQFRLEANGICGDLYANDGQKLGNPAVAFDASSAVEAMVVDLTTHVKVVDTQYHPNLSSQSLLVTVPLTQCADRSHHSQVFGFFDGHYWLHDPRFVLKENTLESPNTEVCTSAPPTFLNEASCILAQSTSCQTSVGVSELPSTVQLNVTTLQLVYKETGKLLYAVDGLRGPWDPPCRAETFSRWVVVTEDNCFDTTIVDTTRSFLQTLLVQAKERQSNPNVLDVFMPYAACDVNDVEKYNYKIYANDACYRNVHPDHWQVFDFTSWTEEHPGGSAAIEQFAVKDGAFVLTFPDWHTMDRWDTYSTQLTSIGRLGDTVTDHPAFEVPQSVSIQGGMSLLCGSPFEVANDASLGGSLLEGAFDIVTSQNKTTSELKLLDQNLMVWMHIALTSKDQLRQRIAWALSQLLVVGPYALESWYSNEVFLTFYDIFVRHAFGNYRDILKEVSYSPAMAEMLSFLDSESTAIVWEYSQAYQFADENFAREIMQLFSIGLYQLNQDGTHVLNEDNRPALTYTNDDIMEYARMWTGFKRQPRRNNIEDFRSPWTGSLVDPMMIRVEARDSLPKMGLNRKYVGDGHPLCADLPSQHFLKRGAVYRLLGPKPKPRLLNDPESWTDSEVKKRFSLDKSSNLHQVLCKISSGACSYPAKVVLESNLECTGIECEIDEPRIIEVSGIYYEYTRLPCVEQAFYNSPVMMTTQEGWAYCADRRTAAGSVACCSKIPGREWITRDMSSIYHWPGAGSSAANISLVEFDGEKTTFESAAGRCEANGMALCEIPWWECNDCNEYLGYWTTHSCDLAAKIHRDGKIGIVHKVTDGRRNVGKDIYYNVRADTKTSFRVDWEDPLDDLLDSYDTQCASIGCKLDSMENLCFCPVSGVSNSRVFSSTPSVNQVLRQLPIGSFPPDILPGNYSVTHLGGGVRMHSTDGLFSTKSIFQVKDANGVTHFRKNVKSTVTIGSGALSFRNPPHFISLAYPELRDAVYETDVGLDHYFHHPNMAPFLASRMLQRFGQSNPSPRLISRVANAFRTGFYSVGDVSLGSRTYGDMLAMMAAILLDRESRAPVLDADPLHGSLQEPFLRYVRLMRSLEFTPSADAPFVRFLTYFPNALAQQPHLQLSVFSFFRPEYAPPGPVGDGGLYCPECQIADGPKTINLMNALISLMKYGLSYYYGGFGYQRSVEPSIGNYSNSFGHLALKLSDSLTPTQVVDTLALLLTAGRLDAEKRKMMVDVFNSAVSRPEGIITVGQMMLTTPEFHTNTLSQNNGGAVVPPPLPTQNTKPYKAVVYVMLSGGADSFNMLIPQVCTGTNTAGVTVDQQYNAERGDLAVPPEERYLQIAATGQPCSTFAIHKELPLYKSLYDAGDLTFVANMGVLNEVSGMDKVNYMTKTRIQLFAHNWMQQETKTMDPKVAKFGTGILGRMTSVLKDKGYTPGSISFDIESIAVVPERTKTPKPLVVTPYGVSVFDTKPISETFNLTSHAKRLNAKPGLGDSLFGQTWAARFLDGMNDAAFFKTYIEQAPLGDHWTWDMSHLGFQFRTLSTMVKSRSVRGVDRDVFYTESIDWDHHAGVVSGLERKFGELNAALDLLVTELKYQGVWNDVTIVVASEFGRTLTSNSGGGSDHGWGGHYVMLGGGVKGGRILGQYPSDVTESGSLNVDRGRFIPTTSWQTVWNGIAQWMGFTEESELDYCLPNRNATSGADGFTPLFSESDLFETSSAAIRELL